MAPKSKKPAPVPKPNQAAPALDDIDLSAALPPGPPPKRGRGRPRSTAPKPPRKYKVRKDKGVKKTKPTAPSQFPYIDNSNIYINNGSSIIEGEGEPTTGSNLKGKLNLKELKFISLYFSGEHGKLKSMKLAGYEAAHDTHLYLQAKKIIERYESQAGDHRIIARAMGAGEVFVLNSLISLMKSKNERIRLDATVNLAKILGLTKDQVESATGITIVFEQSQGQGPAALPLPALPTQEQEQATLAPAYAGRVLQITK